MMFLSPFKSHRGTDNLLLGPLPEGVDCAAQDRE